MININYGMNQEILAQCKLLLDYAKYVDRIRKHAILLSIEDAVEQAITECINEDILTELLTKYRREVIQVSIFEYDAEKEMKLFREAERGAGKAEGALHQLFQLVQESLLSSTIAAEKAGMTEDIFIEKMKEAGY